MNDIPNPNAVPDGEDFDPALDVLLHESIGGPRPPDMKREILSRLRETAQQQTSAPPPVVRAESTGNESNALRYALMTFAVAVSIFIVAILVQRQRSVGVGKPGSSDIADSNSKSPSIAKSGVGARSATDPDARSLAKDMPVDRRSMDDDASDSDSDPDISSTAASEGTKPRTLSSSSDGGEPTSTGPGDGVLLSDLLQEMSPAVYEIRDGQAVSSDIESTLVGYWSSLGVSPTTPLSDAELADTIRQRLGVTFETDQINDPSVVRRQITVPINASELSRRFLQHLTNQDLGTVSNDRNAGLRELVADCFEGQSRLDSVLSELVSGMHPASSQWYTSMSHGGRHGMVQRIASLAMNQDIRCFRCHDGYIDARGRQSDYWSFAGMMFQDLQQESQTGRWQIASSVGSADGTNATSGQPIAPAGDVFYDAIDGRRVAVKAGVPVAWLDGGAHLVQDSESIAKSTVSTWAPTLRGSRALAGGLVNVIWRMVHDRPLTQSVADVNAAPRDAKLDDLHTTLADDLVASNFDIARTLALVITSPVTRRSVADPYKIEAAGQMVDAETQQAFMAFAAAKPVFRRRSIADRLDTILATSGSTLSVLKDGGALLAQPLVNEAGPTSSTPQESLRDAGERIEIQDFPIVQSDLPVAWLASVKDPQSRLGHVCFMAGRTSIPNVVTEANSAMEEAGVEEPLRLSRVWWMVRP